MLTSSITTASVTTASFIAALHVFFVVLFLGVTYSFIFIASAARAEPQNMVFALGINRKIQETLVIPGGLLIFASGLYLAIDQNLFDAEDNLWLNISMTWYLIAWLIGTFVAYPAVKVMQTEATAMQGPGPPSERFMAKVKLMNVVGPFLGFSILAITFLMVTKPF